MKITLGDLGIVEVELNRAARKAGIKTRFEVISGSRGMGTAYRLESLDSNEFAMVIGRTRAETVRHMKGMISAFEIVARERPQPPPPKNVGMPIVIHDPDARSVRRAAEDRTDPWGAN